MKKHSSNRSGILLMELIIAILFFSVVSAICLQLFVKSHNLSKDSETLTHAVNEVVSVAECLQYPDQGIDLLSELYPDFQESDRNYFVYYDKHFNYSEKGLATYYLQIIPTIIDDSTVSYAITFHEASKKSVIYESAATSYKQATP